MFGSSMDYTTRNENGEYEVAQGISASTFKAILVSRKITIPAKTCGMLCLLCQIPAIFASPLPTPMQCWMTLQQALSLQTTLHGEGGER